MMQQHEVDIVFTKSHADEFSGTLKYLMSVFNSIYVSFKLNITSV